MRKIKVNGYFYIVSLIVLMIFSGCATTQQYISKPQHLELYEDYSRIKFVRPNIPYCTACPVKITVNGEIIGKIGPGGEMIYDTLSGDLRIIGLETLNYKYFAPLDLSAKSGNIYTITVKIPGYYFELSNTKETNRNIVSIFDNKTAIDEEKSIEHMKKATKYIEKDLVDNAIDEFKLAIKYNPEFADAHFALGFAYSIKNDYESAMQEFKISIKYKPEFADAHAQLAIAYSQLNLFDKAMQENQIALKYKPNYPLALKNLGLIYGFKGLTTLSVDYLYQAGLQYIAENDRESAFLCIDGIKMVDENSTLINKLTDKLYSNDFESNIDEEKISSSGSGSIISESGLVVTNYHVIEDKTEISVLIPQQKKEYNAELILKDKNNDLAILRLQDFVYSDVFSNTIPFTIISSSNSKLGEDVFTLGYPLGEILGRSTKFSSGKINALFGIQDDPRVYQISTPIQPGNSGGPLFNSSGEFIGIVFSSLNAKFFYENSDIIPQNVNFAVKSNYLLNLISLLPEEKEISNRSNLLSSLSNEKQIELIQPFIVNVKAK